MSGLMYMDPGMQVHIVRGGVNSPDPLPLFSFHEEGGVKPRILHVYIWDKSCAYSLDLPTQKPNRSPNQLAVLWSDALH